MSSSATKLNYSKFIEFLSESGFSGKLPCDIKVSYHIKGESVKTHLKFLKDCKYELQSFDLLYFKPVKEITVLVGREYSPIFQICE